MSKFSFYYGSMGSGKSLDLIKTAYNYKEKGMRVLVYKPKTDTREGSEKCIISTRVGLELEATWLEESGEKIESFLFEELLSVENPYNLVRVILVDEAQFLTKEQVVGMKKFSIRYGTPFIFYGLKVDFQGELFEGTKALISLSEKLSELITMCPCGKTARQNARVVNGKIIREGEQIAIEGETKYVALCNKCYLTKEEIDE